jgi:hypothetical protein
MSRSAASDHLCFSVAPTVMIAMSPLMPNFVPLPIRAQLTPSLAANHALGEDDVH